jgi:hypothetical protein
MNHGKHPQGYTVKELDALLNSIEGLNRNIFDKKIDPRDGTVIDGEVVVYKENVERALRFAAPRYYASKPELSPMYIYEVKIKDRYEDAPYFQITVEASDLDELNSKVSAILNALNKL